MRTEPETERFAMSLLQLLTVLPDVFCGFLDLGLFSQFWKSIVKICSRISDNSWYMVASQICVEWMHKNSSYPEVWCTFATRLKLVKGLYPGGLGIHCVELASLLSFGLHAVLQKMEALISRQFTCAGMCQRMKVSPCSDPSTQAEHVLGAWPCGHTLPALCSASAPCDARPHFQGQAAISRVFWRNMIDMSMPRNYLHYLNR